MDTDSKLIANWLLNDLKAILKKNNADLKSILPSDFSMIVALFKNNVIDKKLAKIILNKMVRDKKSLKTLINEALS